ncbi:transcriptional activator, TenA family [halophilic archaeon DL31]|nr:transcriptional activator, TenA family [halophilic archaeon DL31]
MAPGGVGGVTATFDAYATDRTDARFTDWLRARSEPDWTDAVEHRFVHELADGTVDDAVFRRYLVQDYAFVWTLTGVFGYAVGQAPTMDAKASLTGFLGTLTDEENDYFERSFDALGVSPDERTDPVPADATEAFEDLLTRAALEGEYEETLAESKPDALELVLTGGHEEPDYLTEVSDLITNVRKVKHPFDEGHRARKGTEF